MQPAQENNLLQGNDKEEEKKKVDNIYIIYFIILKFQLKNQRIVKEKQQEPKPRIWRICELPTKPSKTWKTDQDKTTSF